eukprot:gnl/MRDRNA2_/MRDRNA2_35398_c0_seq1.p1 gnl/MRDRNA2_/MRDRNA2_35398_c0~~gnl/MRDRNA2_/MRDRNA2_35398_c0_seq1.p1  ORF type:complete len:274 (+),score=57.02 gnl/MRDRNA2_/MRDRNA2_35398_c0_seq1:49-822(+)
MIALAPLYADCADSEISCQHIRTDEDENRFFALLYETQRGGVGKVPLLYENWEGLLSRAIEVIDCCPCQEGCPHCIISSRCAEYNDGLDKAAALKIGWGLGFGKPRNLPGILRHREMDKAREALKKYKEEVDSKESMDESALKQKDMKDRDSPVKEGTEPAIKQEDLNQSDRLASIRITENLEDSKVSCSCCQPSPSRSQSITDAVEIENCKIEAATGSEPPRRGVFKRVLNSSAGPGAGFGTFKRIKKESVVLDLD